PFLRSLFALQGTSRWVASITELPVAELNREEAEYLASLLAGGEPLTAAAAESIAQESKGNPYFISELVHYSQARGGVALGTDTKAAGKVPAAEQSDSKPEQEGQGSEPARPFGTLDNVIWLRISQLPEQARRLLEVVAVAARPIGLDLVKP